ncbi:MAG: hypothetical protein NWF01_00190 [Candidatus Bathyarchaeota archaeon]|nr:hypothetical protein [Candidatus Bathyarchaeota archaeon]
MEKQSFFVKIMLVLTESLHIINACRAGVSSKSSKFDVLCDQIIDSAIVGGITGVSAYVAAGENASITATVLAFILTFLIKMKEYRNIK